MSAQKFEIDDMSAVLSKVYPGMPLREQRELLISALAEEEVPDYLKTRMAVDAQIIEELEEEVERLRAAIDRDVSDFIDRIVSGIRTNYDVAESINNFNEAWFRMLIMSDGAKTELAKALIKTCFPFVRKNVPTLWLNLALSVPEIVKRVRFTVEDAQRT